MSESFLTKERSKNLQKILKFFLKRAVKYFYLMLVKSEMNVTKHEYEIELLKGFL